MSGRSESTGDVTRPAAVAAIFGLVVASAAMLAAARSADGPGWLAAAGLIPLFLCIARLRPLPALAGGSIWGAIIAAWPLGVVDGLSVPAIAAIAAAVGTYTAGGSWATRRIGFSPFVLAAGWILLELAIAPLGARHGIVAAAMVGDASVASAVAQSLGYVAVAFVVAYLNALLFAALGRAGARLRGVRLLVPGAPRLLLAAPSFVSVRRFASSRPGSPRAPPD